jgi:hypothetical protein
MRYIEEIPMEEPYRQQLRNQYLKPLRRGTIAIVIFVIIILSIIGGAFFGTDGLSYFILLLLIPFGYIIMIFYGKLSKQNIHFLKDSEFGFIIKEQVTITKVFETPAGINIYWIDCDAIKTFTPDPYCHFYAGDRVVIYYLKYSKEYLAYEMSA